MPPLSEKDEEIEKGFEERYGKRGKSVYYATINKGKRLQNTPEARRMKKRRKTRRSKRR